MGGIPRDKFALKINKGEDFKTRGLGEDRCVLESCQQFWPSMSLEMFGQNLSDLAELFI